MIIGLFFCWQLKLCSYIPHQFQDKDAGEMFQRSLLNLYSLKLWKYLNTFYIREVRPYAV